MSNLMNEFIEEYNSLRTDFKKVSPYVRICEEKISDLEKEAIKEESTFLILGSLSFYMYTPMSDVDVIALTKKDYSSQMYVAKTIKRKEIECYLSDILILTKKSEVIDPDNFLDCLDKKFDNSYSNTILTNIEYKIFNGCQKGFLMTINRSLKKYVSRLKENRIETNHLENKTKYFIDHFSNKIN